MRSEPEPTSPTAGIQLCVAHFCDVHGPTPLMVTEELPVPCSTCSDQDRPLESASPTTSASSYAAAVSSSSSMKIPPRMPPEAPPQAQYHHDPSFRRTYDDNVTKRAGPCESCAMTLPPSLQQMDPEPSLELNPTLRSLVPWAIVHSHRDPSSSLTSTIPNHIHHMRYISTRGPLVANSLSSVRDSCLRALSFETLPQISQPSSGSGGVYPTAQAPRMTSQPFVTTHSTGAAATGGPIFFGNPRTGYTIVFIFHIPDIHARGGKRVFVMKTFIVS